MNLCHSPSSGCQIPVGAQFPVSRIHSVLLPGDTPQSIRLQYLDLWVMPRPLRQIQVWVLVPQCLVVKDNLSDSPDHWTVVKQKARPQEETVWPTPQWSQGRNCEDLCPSGGCSGSSSFSFWKILPCLLSSSKVGLKICLPWGLIFLDNYRHLWFLWKNQFPGGIHYDLSLFA